MNKIIYEQYKQLNEKYSDVEHLTDEIVYFVKLRLNELDGKQAKYTRKQFQYEKTLSNGDIIDIFINLDHTKSYKDSLFHHEREITIGIKELVDFSGKFSILYNREMVNKILSVVAHEITHYSQILDKSLDVDNYDENRHSEMTAEHEAKMVELFSLIKSKEYDLMIDLLYRRKKYFENISWKEFYKDMITFGISEHEYRKLEKYLEEYSINLKEFFNGD